MRDDALAYGVPLTMLERHNVVNHYDAFWKLQLSDKAKADLIEYLKSI